MAEPRGEASSSAVVATSSPEESFDLARRLGELLRGGEVVALVGDLGSGKTTFTRGLACGLACPQYQKVNSPTYVLEQIYEGRVPLHHYDAYRLEGGGDLLALGFLERLDGQRVVVLEWADRVGDCLPPARLLVEIEPVAGGSPSSRRIRFSGPRDVWAAVIDRLEKNG
ncbi:MAG: tRNA (adenosine(37)-N6)-threonylcarbamoyltransferase complex ATPase subunit type 1 TsaE [Planctomycetes bacterium]|nr:tRNA (adenosine(37)-N6)-threonylcarbamoyltransferase complex ATPase subunit type 1 TsaE [Planctomycetota bacterium]